MRSGRIISVRCDSECLNYDEPKSTWSWTRLPHALTSFLDRISTSSKNSFANNSIRTARYTIVTFLPKQLIAQFSKFANLYFAFISILQAVPGWSPTGRFTTIAPLTVFVVLSMAREAYDDYHRYKSDISENHTLVHRLKPTLPSKWESLKRMTARPYPPLDDISDNPESQDRRILWERVFWKNLIVGDIVKVFDKEFIPADLVVINSEHEEGICYIETANLDGETNYKQRHALQSTKASTSNEYDLMKWQGIVISNQKAKLFAESPNGNLYSFQGSIELEVNNLSQKHPLTVSQLALRGSTLANSGSIIGVVVYTGEESKIRMNANDFNRAKSPLMEHMTNNIILLLFSIVLFLAALSTIASYIWEEKVNSSDTALWYLAGLTPDYVATFFSFVILFNALIPISLYVTLEMIKLVQIYFINHDLLMYDPKSGCFAEARTSAINEDLGQIQYIFSDKTGTLTENLMIFRKFCVIGLPFSLAHDKPLDPSLYSKEENSVGDFFKDFRGLCDADSTLDFSRGLDFIRALALCHTCQLEKFSRSKNKSSSYQSSSPDEVALVSGARDMKCCFKSRISNTVTAECGSEEERYTLLNTIEFTSKRRRMSCIYEYPDGRLILLVKGADSVISERFSLESIAQNQLLYDNTANHNDRFANEGLRTLYYAYRELSRQEYTDWNADFEQAALSLENRIDKMEEVAENIEKNLILLGSTAIEDKLQSEVPETIDKLRRAGIKLWMLTGDKKGTAVNIGSVCRIIKSTSHVVTISGSDMTEIDACVNAARIQVKQLKSPSLSDSSSDPEHVVLVIEGDIFTKIQQHHESITPHKAKRSYDQVTLNSSTLLRFLDLAVTADNSICCRFSPSQKSFIVARVKTMLSESYDGSIGMHSSYKVPTLASRALSYLSIKKFSGLTLAIGDGANDIPMIESAHVGIGITGREGLAAARASDYSIAQFRFLQPLLFVHGRYNYQRTALFTFGTFYKSLAFYLCQLFFQIFTGWSGTSLFEQWTLALYNVLFSSLPVLVIGMFEKDLNISTLLNVPELYQSGQRNVYYNAKVFSRWMLQGFIHAAIATIIPLLAFSAVAILEDCSGQFQSSSLVSLGTLCYTIVILITISKIGLLESHNWTIFTFIAASLTISSWWLYQFVYAMVYPRLTDLGYDSVGLFYQLAQTQPTIWLMVFLVTCIAIILCDLTFNFTTIMWSSWRHFMTELQLRPVLLPADGSSILESLVEKGAGKEFFASDFENAGNAAARVSAEWVGPWTFAAPWWQEWERIHGITPTLGLDGLRNSNAQPKIEEMRFVAEN